MTSLRICFCNSNPVWGGGEHWHLTFAKLLLQRGHSTRILTSTGSELEERALESGLPCTTMSLGRLSFLDPLFMAGLVGFFRKNRFHACVLGLPQDVKASGMAARIARVPAVVYRRGMGLPVRDTVFNRFLYRRVLSAVIVNSRDTGKALLTNNPALIPKERIHLLPNGLEDELLVPPPPCDSAQPPVIIGTAGRLVEQKGQRLLVLAANILRDKGLDFEVRVAGEGALRSELESMVREFGLEERVHFLGFVQDMRAFMESCQIFAIPSLWEGMGRAPLEAMAAGRPVVGFHVSSMDEVVVHDETGLLVPGNDSKALAQALERLIRDPALRSRLGIAGHRRVCDSFSLRTMLPRFENILDSLVTPCNQGAST